MPQTHATTPCYPRLIADIGGTNARFAIERAPFVLSDSVVLACKDYDTIFAAISDYRQQIAIDLPTHVGIAIANPVTDDVLQMTNHHWQFSISELKAQLGVETLLFINDFRAQALAITAMQDEHLLWLNGPKPGSPVSFSRALAVVGPGTGLGVSGLIPDRRGGMVALAGEGGHVAFTPYDALEQRLLAFAERIFNGHVSAERLLQGEGLLLIYRFFAHEKGQTPNRDTPADITRGALEDNDPLCVEVLSRYCGILGSFCANVVLTVGGTGGLYLSGGIVPRFIDFLRQSDFRQRFEDKGRFADYMQAIPTFVVTHPQPGLLGAAVALNQHLSSPN